jgi:hypothetical protein
MTEDLSDCPAALARRPQDSAGRPVPFFVAWVDGKPDFRIADGQALRACLEDGRCWVCGKPIIGAGFFPIGPMCVVNRNTAEPPSHRRCAEWSARHCPFLNTPGKARREAHKPEGTSEPGGEMIHRNPGVVAIYKSATWQVYPHERGILIDIGEPMEVTWWREGRPATRAEVQASIESGLPVLMEMAMQEGQAAVDHLEHCLARTERLIP